jgi:hypothetical protein
VTVFHNTIVAPAHLVEGEGPIAGISIPFGGGNNAGAVFRDNIVFASHSETFLLYGGEMPAGDGGFAGLTFDHNLWFHAARARAFHWGPDGAARADLTHAEWVARSAGRAGVGDVLAPPRFRQAGNYADPQGMRLLPVSPAIDAGVDTGVTEDFSGTPRGGAGMPDLGAFEFVAER